MKKLIKSGITILLLLVLVAMIGSHALFSDQVFTENNTFSTGTVQLKLFYDCQGDGFNPGLDEVTYTDLVSGTLPGGDTGAIVGCPLGGVAGAGERAGLGQVLLIESVDSNTLIVRAKP